MDEKNAQTAVEESLTYKNGHYTVAIPWKQEKHNLPYNYDMALSRLQNTEKRLLKSNEIAEIYQKIIKYFEKKEYIEKIHTGTNSSQENKKVMAGYHRISQCYARKKRPQKQE